MNTFIAILRGINVGGHRKIKMADLKTMLTNLGFVKVNSYIQSGNIVFNSKSNNTKELEISIQTEIENSFKLEVPVLVLKKENWNQIYSNTPFDKRIENEIKFLHVTFLDKKPDDELVKNVLSMDKQLDEEMIFEKTQIYLYYPRGYGKTKFHNGFFETKLKVKATTRNWRTITKLNEMTEEN